MGCAGSCVKAQVAGQTREDASGGADGNNSRLAPETQQLRSEYTLGQVLGQGAFGVVYACSKVGQNKYEYAVKMVDKVETPINEIKREAEMLKLCAHPNIVKFHAIYYEKFFVCIVMDRYEGGDMIEGMQAHWKLKGQIPCTKVIHVSRQMCAAIHHLHSKDVVHRDVKGDNYLMDRKDLTDPGCKIIMSDFGTAVKLQQGERLSAAVGTKIYWPPEFFNADYSLKVDMWALGVIMYGLLVGRFPFKGEKDAREKAVKLPSSTPPKCSEYIVGLLQKKEADRFDANTAFAHAWLRADGMDNVEVDPNFKADVAPERGANAGVAARRAELVERVENAQKRGQKDNTVMSILCHPCFEVHNKHTNRTLKYEWWKRERVEAEKVVNFQGAKTEANDGMVSTQSLRVVEKMLNEHGINTKAFGVGGAKSLEQFVAEVHNGAALLMLDATEHKKLVRVVDVILLRISVDVGGKKFYLIEWSETRKNGHVVHDLNRLPGTKKEPHENSKKTAERIVADFLNLRDCPMQYNFKSNELFEVEEESFSYPGVRTLYRKEIIPVTLKADENRPEHRRLLERIGIQKNKAFGGRYSHTDHNSNTKEFAWLSDEECSLRSVALRAPKEGEEVSGLVQAPIGYTEEELTEYLTTNGLDISKFGADGARTLKEFATELMKGEASLMLQRDGSVIRIVDIVCLLLHKEKEVLVMALETHPDGSRHKLNLLPGAKRRPDENQFLTAQRILKRQLKLDENCVNLSAKDVKILEEEKDSPSYPGMRTLYRKRIITAELLLGGAQGQGNS